MRCVFTLTWWYEEFRYFFESRWGWDHLHKCCWVLKKISLSSLRISLYCCRKWNLYNTFNTIFFRRVIINYRQFLKYCWINLGHHFSSLTIMFHSPKLILIACWFQKIVKFNLISPRLFVLWTILLDNNWVYS